MPKIAYSEANKAAQMTLVLIFVRCATHKHSSFFQNLYERVTRMIYLYTSSVSDFVKHANTGEISSILKQEFPKKFDKRPGEQEVTSWSNSLKALASILEDPAFRKAHIFLEFQMPLCSARCDAIIVGKDTQGNSNAIILELKQWQYVTYSDKDRVLLGGKGHLHPSAQVKGYCNFLEYYHEAFTDERVRISGCAYLHNMDDSKAINMLNNRCAGYM
jgi:hypothetical protein